VINQDRVWPGQGFGVHPHRDMEIFSYVLEGALEHKDSLGNSPQASAGSIQLMSAGTGVTHSEYNPSKSEGLHFLQNLDFNRANAGSSPATPNGIQRRTMDNAAKVLVISPDGRDESATIHQDAEVYRLRLKADASVTHELKAGRGLWLQVIRGNVTLNGTALEAGDGASSEQLGIV